MKVMEYSVVVHKAEEGGYWLEVPALEGCFTQGETMKEVIRNAKQAIKLYLEGLEELGQAIPRDESLSVRKIAVSMGR